MPSIRLMGFAAGALFILSSAGNAQTPRPPARPCRRARHLQRSSRIRRVRARGFRLRTVTRGLPTRAPRATTAAGMLAARPAIPAGTTSAGPATTRAASAGRGPGWGCGPAWASAASARGADRPQVLRSPCGGAPAWTYGLTRGGVGGGRLMGAAAGEEIRTSTGAAGRHSGGDPALRSGRTDRSGWWASVPHRACGRRRRTTQRTDVGGGRPSLPKPARRRTGAAPGLPRRRPRPASTRCPPESLTPDKRTS